MKRFLIGLVLAVIMAILSLFLLTYIPFVNDLFVMAGRGDVPSICLAGISTIGFIALWGSLISLGWPRVTVYAKRDGKVIFSETKYL